MAWPVSPDILRLSAFVAVFTAMALLEHRWPRRPLRVAKSIRWRINLLIIVAEIINMPVLYIRIIMSHTQLLYLPDIGRKISTRFYFAMGRFNIF